MGAPPARAAAIRPVHEDDAAALAELLAQLGHPLALDQVAANVRALLASPGYGTFAAVLEERVVGAVSAFATPVLHRPRPVGRVSVLVVDEALTGRGIGAALLGHAEEFLRALGCARIEVTSATHREAAHRFYRQHGYAQQGLRFSRELPARE